MIHDAAASGYRKHSAIYAAARPAYHPELIQRLRDTVQAFSPVELGAGTGIFTRQLVEAGYHPLAIEPVEQMRAELHAMLPEVDVREGTAEATGLPASSTDAVLVAQAFHWFDHPAALREIHRILRPGGHLACAWNSRDANVDWVADYEAIINTHAGDTPRHASMAWRRAIDACHWLELVDEWNAPNPQIMDADGLVARALSTSFIATLDPATQAAVANRVRTVAPSPDAPFAFPYRTEMQVWRKRTDGMPSR